MEKQFRKYLNGTCNPEEFTDLLEAIEGKEDNDQMSSEIFELWDATLKGSIENKENDQLLDKIHHRISLDESRSLARQFTLYRNLLKIAAVLIVGLLVSTAIFYNIPEKQPFTTLIETVTTPFGARTSFKLPDGSEVWLNSGSTISFPKQFGDIRSIELTGEAYFKVVKDGKRFMVSTDYGKVEVMGTSFDVKAYPKENFETTLVEGSVKVKNLTNKLAILESGQQSVITPSNEFSVNEVNTDLRTSWKEGKLIFVKEPFQNVVKALERWYNVKIELQGERLKKLGFTGTIEMESFGEVLELINATTPITYKFDKNTRILIIYQR